MEIVLQIETKNYQKVKEKLHLLYCKKKKNYEKSIMTTVVNTSGILLMAKGTAKGYTPGLMGKNM